MDTKLDIILSKIENLSNEILDINSVTKMLIQSEQQELLCSSRDKLVLYEILDKKIHRVFNKTSMLEKRLLNFINE